MLCITVLLAVSLFTNDNLYSPNVKCLVSHYLFVYAYLIASVDELQLINFCISLADFIFYTLGSSEITSPALSLIGEAAPVSLEPWALFLKIIAIHHNYCPLF